MIGKKLHFVTAIHKPSGKSGEGAGIAFAARGDDRETHGKLAATLTVGEYPALGAARGIAQGQSPDVTNVRFLQAAPHGRIGVRAAESRMSLHQSTAGKRVPWGFLAWAVPLAYVLWAPYQHRAGWFEWTATAATLSGVMALFLAGITYIDNRRRVAVIGGTLLPIAVAFLAYRPSGGIYFPVVATLVAPAVGGNIGRSITILSALAVLFGAEWWLLYWHGSQAAFFPVFVLGEIFLSGIGVIFAVRHTREVQRRDKASERERIAKDLHDVLGHSLSSLALKAELARRVFHSDPGRALSEINEVERIARQGLSEMRGAVHGYYAGDIYVELDRVESTLKAANVSVERRCERLEIPAATERVLALILREAATNIVRHSRAKACRFVMCQADGEYRLEISDNGCGGKCEEGIGMRSIRTRAEALGGTAVWSCATGTRLSVTLPMPAAGQV
ncbi:MAG: histidine kinase [Steroidobacteraceae bacterium]